MDNGLRQRIDDLPPGKRAELLARLRDRQADGPRDAIQPAPPGAEIPLSYPQERLWLLDEITRHRPVYHTPLVLRVRGRLDPQALGQALRTLITRHAVLRTRLVQGRQLVDEAPSGIALPVEDLSALPDPAQALPLAMEQVNTAAREAFDLAAAAPLRARLWRLAADDHVFALLAHHILMDDWSVPLLLRELGEAYQAARSGSRPRLPRLPVQYGDYALWQRARLSGPAGARQAEYWSRQLAGLSVVPLPADRARPRQPTWAGETVPFATVAPGLTARLTATYREPPITVLAAALNAVLARWTLATDVAIGTVVSGRIRPEIESLIGFFANTVVVRTSASGDPALRTLAARTAESFAGAYAHQELPFEHVVADYRKRHPDAGDPFQVMLVSSEVTAGPLPLGELIMEACDIPLGTARFDLMLGTIRQADGGLRLNAEYSTEIFDRPRIRRLLDDLVHTLTVMADRPDTPLSQLPLAPPPPGLGPQACEANSLAAATDTASPVWQAVAGLWCEITATPQAHPDDSFFAVGGTSTQAVALAAEIRDQLGVDVDLSEFFARPVLSGLAQQVMLGLQDDMTEPAARQEYIILPLRSGDSAYPPVFFFHESSGSCVPYMALCRELPEGVRCLGVEAVGLDSGPLPGSVDEMATAYAAAIRQALPSGPYRLAGWSVGGGLAYATAVRLREQHCHVTLLAMLDTQQPPVLASPPDPADLCVLFADNLARTVGAPAPELTAASLAGLQQEAQHEQVIAVLAQAGLVPDGSVPLLRRRMRVFSAILTAASVWRPDRYDGRIDLFLSADSSDAVASAWAASTSGETVTHRVPGDHYSMLRPPYAGDLGRSLAPLLEGIVNARR